VADLMCFLGVLGIALMIISNELNFTRDNDADTVASWFIKLFITLTTALLLVLIVYYHRIDLENYCAQNALDDWRVGLTSRRTLQIISELFICAIHPMPRTFPDSHQPSVYSVDKEPYPLSYISVDVALGLPSEWTNTFDRSSLHLFV
jgi:hypothetical protein